MKFNQDIGNISINQMWPCIFKCPECGEGLEPIQEYTCRTDICPTETYYIYTCLGCGKVYTEKDIYGGI